MISQTAMEDIERLKQDGIEVSPADVVRLNSFGLKIEKSSESAEQYVLHRVAMLGDIVIHEPTIGDEIYKNELERMFDLSDQNTFILILSYVLSTDQDKRPKSTDKEAIRIEVEQLKQKLSKYTVNQLWNALIYVEYGNLVSDGEKKPKTRKQIVEEDQKEEKQDDENTSICYGVMKNACILGLGSMEQIKKFTQFEMQMMMELKLQMENGSQRKSAHAKNLAEYYAVLEEIKDKAKKQ